MMPHSFLRTPLRMLARTTVWTVALLTGAASMAHVAHADATTPAAPASSMPVTVSGTVGLVSEYTFRGISQSDERPAVQGGLTLSMPVTPQGPSVYAGAWGSSVDFNDGDEASMELDFIAGVTHSWGAVSLDAGLIYYAYPGADSSLEYDFIEGQVTLGYQLDPVLLRAAAHYTPTMFLDSGDAVYLKLAAEAPLMESLKAHGRVGYQWVDDNAAFGVPDYADWALGLTYTFHGVDVGVEYVDTSLSHSDCADGCEARAVLIVSKAF